jgi:hypothetical protein
VSNSVSHSQCFERFGPAQGENRAHPDLIAARTGCSEPGEQFARLRAIIFGNTRRGELGPSAARRYRRDPAAAQGDEVAEEVENPAQIAEAQMLAHEWKPIARLARNFGLLVLKV